MLLNSVKCFVCGRALKSPRSIAAGVGPVCAKRAKGSRKSGLRFTTLSTSSHYDNGDKGTQKIEPLVIRGMEIELNE